MAKDTKDQHADLERKRDQRSYPHGSGDRNTWSPFGKDRMPLHEGGTQRDAPPEPEEGGMDAAKTRPKGESGKGGAP